MHKKKNNKKNNIYKFPNYRANFIDLSAYKFYSIKYINSVIFKLRDTIGLITQD